MDQKKSEPHKFEKTQMMMAILKMKKDISHPFNSTEKMFFLRIRLQLRLKYIYNFYRHILNKNGDNFLFLFFIYNIFFSILL